MKQLLKVARMGHPVLREKAQEVHPKDISDPELQDLIDSMLWTMEEYRGVGLAAPQVHVSQRIVVFHPNAGLIDPDGQPLTCLINPEIRPLTKETRAMWEGCLSVPGLRGKVSRPARIRVRGLDRRGQKIDLELEEFDAVVTQHECDHLDGVLFIDRLDSTSELSYEEEFERYWLEKARAEGDFIDEDDEQEQE